MDLPILCLPTDVLSILFEYFSVQDLSSLARTCRALLDPALDVLWYHQRSLTNLVKCLPDDLWPVYEGYKDESSFEASDIRDTGLALYSL